MANYNPIMSDAMKSTWASDTTGPTRSKSFKIEVEMLDWLASLEGSPAVHVRQALREYREKIKQEQNEPFDGVARI